MRSALTFHQIVAASDMRARGDAWICTRAGSQFWPLDPRPEEVELDDIAHALSNLCRFNGHCREFYSVAQHSVLVSEVCDPAVALWGLLHDASEAYLVDLPRPVKRTPAMAAYRRAEAAVMRAVCARFGLDLQAPESVRRADERLLATEARDLMPAASVARWCLEGSPLPDRILAWTPRYSRTRFLARFRKLTEGGAHA